MHLSTTQLATENDLLLADLFMCVCGLPVKSPCVLITDHFKKGTNKLAF